jgi:glycosyltransferase involved in cell wall biosynthesis
VATSLLAPVLAVNFRDVDVFVGANQPGAWIAYCMAKVLRKQYVVYMNQPNRLLYPREVDQEGGWVNEESYAFLARLIWVFRYLMKKIDRVSFKEAEVKLVNGSYIGGVIEGVYRMETVECPAGAHAQPRERLLKEGEAFKGKVEIGKQVIKKPYVLLTNRHDPQKKFEYAIEAMKSVKKKFPKVQLVIPGPYTAHTPKLIRLIKELGLVKQVVFLGQVSEAELQQLYRQAAVYVYSAPQEDFGMGPLEAGGWGVPTVAWDNAGPTVTIEDGVTGFLAKPFKVKDYAEKIMKLMGDKGLQFKMGRAAWRRVKKEFSWQRHIDILEKEIKKVLRNR